MAEEVESVVPAVYRASGLDDQERVGWVQPSRLGATQRRIPMRGGPPRGGQSHGRNEANVYGVARGSQATRVSRAVATTSRTVNQVIRNVERLPIQEFQRITDGAVNQVIRHGNVSEMAVVWRDGALHHFALDGRSVVIDLLPAYTRRGHRIFPNRRRELVGSSMPTNNVRPLGSGLRGTDNPARGLSRRGAVRGHGFPR